MQAQSPALSFAPLLSEVLTNSTPLRPCDKDEGGCGALIPTSHVLDKAPTLFTVGGCFLSGGFCFAYPILIILSLWKRGVAVWN